MLINDRYVDEVQTEVLAYLDEHPKAMDSADGIRRWWLTQRLAKYSNHRVQTALDGLVEDGVLTERESGDGRTVYARNKESSDCTPRDSGKNAAESGSAKDATVNRDQHLQEVGE